MVVDGEPSPPTGYHRYRNQLAASMSSHASSGDSRAEETLGDPSTTAADVLSTDGHVDRFEVSLGDHEPAVIPVEGRARLSRPSSSAASASTTSSSEMDANWTAYDPDQVGDYHGSSRSSQQFYLDEDDSSDASSSSSLGEAKKVVAEDVRPAGAINPPPAVVSEPLVVEVANDAPVKAVTKEPESIHWERSLVPEAVASTPVEPQDASAETTATTNEVSTISEASAAKPTRRRSEALSSSSSSSSSDDDDYENCAVFDADEFRRQHQERLAVAGPTKDDDASSSSSSSVGLKATSEYASGMDVGVAKAGEAEPAIVDEVPSESAVDTIADEPVPPLLQHLEGADPQPSSMTDELSASGRSSSSSSVRPSSKSSDSSSSLSRTSDPVPPPAGLSTGEHSDDESTDKPDVESERSVASEEKARLPDPPTTNAWGAEPPGVEHLSEDSSSSPPSFDVSGEFDENGKAYDPEPVKEQSVTKQDPEKTFDVDDSSSDSSSHDADEKNCPSSSAVLRHDPSESKEPSEASSDTAPLSNVTSHHSLRGRNDDPPPQVVAAADCDTSDEDEFGGELDKEAGLSDDAKARALGLVTAVGTAVGVGTSMELQSSEETAEAADVGRSLNKNQAKYKRTRRGQADANEKRRFKAQATRRSAEQSQSLSSMTKADNAAVTTKTSPPRKGPVDSKIIDSDGSGHLNERKSKAPYTDMSGFTAALREEERSKAQKGDMRSASGANTFMLNAKQREADAAIVSAAAAAPVVRTMAERAPGEEPYLPDLPPSRRAQNALALSAPALTLESVSALQPTSAPMSRGAQSAVSTSMPARSNIDTTSLNASSAVERARKRQAVAMALEAQRSTTRDETVAPWAPPPADQMPKPKARTEDPSLRAKREQASSIAQDAKILQQKRIEQSMRSSRESSPPSVVQDTEPEPEPKAELSRSESSVAEDGSKSCSHDEESEAPNKTERRPEGRWVYIVCGIWMLILPLVLGLSFGLTKGKRNGEGEDSDAANASDVTTAGPSTSPIATATRPVALSRPTLSPWVPPIGPVATTVSPVVATATPVVPTARPVAAPTASPLAPTSIPVAPTGRPTVVIDPPTAAPQPQPSSQPSGVTTQPPNGPPTASPSTNLVLLQLLDLLSSVSEDGGLSVQREGTPQNQAFQWLGSSPNLLSYSEARQVQRYALATLFYATSGDAWNQANGWLTEESECVWFSTSTENRCDDTGSFVLLNLTDNKLSGSLPPEIGLLLGLQTIDLQGNSLDGTIPSILGTLTNLLDLNLSLNQLQGVIPGALGALASLNTLNLRANDLSGQIPSSLGELSGLDLMRFDDNDLTGYVPGEVCRSIEGSLTTLYVDCGGASPPVKCPPGLCCTYCCIGIATTGLSTCQCLYRDTAFQFMC